LLTLLDSLVFIGYVLGNIFKNHQNVKKWFLHSQKVKK